MHSSSPDPAPALSAAAAHLADALTPLLARLYPAHDSSALARRLAALAAATRTPHTKVADERWSERDVLLISYGDTLRHPDASPLAGLYDFLTTHLREAISGVHILPFFPYSSDDGFAVVDYLSVDPHLGAWDDIHRIADEFDLMVDLVINHISRESRWFLDFITDTPPHNRFFIELAPDTDVTHVVRPRATPLLTPVITPRGTRHVWATFGEDQIDLNFAEPDVLAAMVEVFLQYLAHGARLIRLDAIAFLWKRLGTPCIHLEETHLVVKLLRALLTFVRPDGVLITETNVPNAENLAYFGQAFDEAHMVYQFALPPLLLHALHRGDGRALTAWARSLPQLPPQATFLNFTASHDGIGLRPAEGLLPEHERDELIAAMRRRGGHISMRRDRHGRDRPYEINISLFDALAGTHRGPDQWQVARFLCGQTIMLALQGVPAVYFHSLTATPNDLIGVGHTGRVRSINRRKWWAQELIALLNDSRSTTAQVFFELTRRMRIRRRQPAFHPNAPQQVLDVGPQMFAIVRGDGSPRTIVVAIANLSDAVQAVDLTGIEALTATPRWFDLIGNAPVDAGTPAVRLRPYQVVWWVPEAAAQR